MPRDTLAGTAVIVAAYALGVISGVAGWVMVNPAGTIAGGIAAVAMFLSTTYAAGQPAAKLATQMDERRDGWSQ